MPGDGLDIVDDFKTVIIGNSIVPIESIGVIFHKLHDEVKDRWKELLGVDLETLIEVPNTLFDEPDNLTPGFYFGDVPRNNLKEYEKILPKVLFGGPNFQGKYGTVTQEGVLELNHHMCHKFLEEVEEIRSIFGSLLHLATSGPYRGTEYAATRVRNTVGGNGRNVKAIIGKLCLVSDYNKTCAIVGLLQYLFIMIIAKKKLTDS